MFRESFNVVEMVFQTSTAGATAIFDMCENMAVGRYDPYRSPVADNPRNNPQGKCLCRQCALPSAPIPYTPSVSDTSGNGQA